MSKLIYTNKDPDFYDRLQSGVDKVTDIVKVTFGVDGRNVGLQLYKNMLPLLTNDGVSVASEVASEDDIEDFAIVLAQEAAHRTEDVAGDGTTSTLVLLQALVAHGMELKKQGISPLKIRKQIEDATEKAAKEIARLARPAKARKVLAHAATISCRDREIGSLIAKVVAKAKKDGMITLEDNLGGKTGFTQLEGLQLRAGYLAKNFINQVETQQIVLENPAFLVTNMRLTSVTEIQHIAEQAAFANVKTLVVFGEDIGYDFMTTAYLNWSRHDTPLKFLPVRFSTASDVADGMLRDVAAVSGAQFIDSFVGEGITNITPESFGHAKRFVQAKKETLIIPGDGKLVDARIEELKGEIKDTINEFQAENIRERIARLRHSCFTIQVGGVTETELQERKTRVKDALNTARAAYELGVVPGGGAALALVAELLSDPADDIVKDACKQTMQQLLVNSDYEHGVSGEEMQQGMTFDCREGIAVDAFEAGILDSTVAVIQSLRNAASVAIQLLLCENIIKDSSINEG